MTQLEKIRDAVARRGFAKAEIIRRAGLHPNALNKLDSEDFNPRLKTLNALERAVDEMIAERA